MNSSRFTTRSRPSRPSRNSWTSRALTLHAAEHRQSPMHLKVHLVMDEVHMFVTGIVDIHTPLLPDCIRQRVEVLQTAISVYSPRHPIVRFPIESSHRLSLDDHQLSIPVPGYPRQVHRLPVQRSVGLSQFTFYRTN